jgi:hypothetical protein
VVISQNTFTAANSRAFHLKLASTPETRETVYRRRYACYRRGGFIDVMPTGQFSDRYDALPNSFSFLAQGAGRDPHGTVRISVVRPDLGWTDSPAQHVFGDHSLFRSPEAASFVEASRLCFDKQARRDCFVQLLGNMAALAELFRTDWLLACPRVEHAPAYQRMFGFEVLAEPRRYFGVSFETMLLGVRRTALAEHVRDIGPMRSAWMRALTMLTSVHQVSG